MHVNSYSKIVPFAERLRDIKSSYGADSKEYAVSLKKVIGGSLRIDENKGNKNGKECVQ